MRDKALILFTGDSITDGNRYKSPESAWDLNHQIGHSYAYVVNAMLGSAYPGKYTFINRGISGNRVSDILTRADADLVDFKPDVVSILAGANDGPHDGVHFTPTSEFESAYRALLEKIKRELPDAEIIICSPFVGNSGTMRERYAIWRPVVDEFFNIERMLAKEYGAVFIDLQTPFDETAYAPSPEYWIWDGIHPTENGHGLIARAWMDAFNAAGR